MKDILITSKLITNEEHQELCDLLQKYYEEASESGIIIIEGGQ